MTLSDPRVVLCVLDGFGISDETARQRDRRRETADVSRDAGRKYPHSRSAPPQEAVGLPHGQQGNSEVGHLNLGAGRVVLAKRHPHRQVRSRTERSRKTRRSSNASRT